MPENERINKKKIYVLGKIIYIWRDFEIVPVPIRYVGLLDEEDDFDFNESFTT